MGSRKIKIFISFASDAEEELKLIKEVIEEETKNHFSHDGYIFEPICWEDISPGLGHPQRDKIDPVIIDQSCRLVIIILKNRLGTKYENGKTGIEHEYEIAKQIGKEVWIYNCDYILKMRRSEIDPEQLKMVNDFLQRVSQEGLFRTVSSHEHLSSFFRSDFAKWARELITNESNLSNLNPPSKFENYSRGF